jgi:hypothetical protein
MRYIELYKFDLGTQQGSSYVYYWATQDVPSTVSFDSQNYDAMVVRDSMQKLPRPVGDSEKKVTIKVRNDTGQITDLLDLGVYFEHGRVSVVRIFPDLAKVDQNVGDWTNPYWHGRIVAVKEVTRDWAVFELAFGYLDLSKRFGRVLHSSCHNIFADDDHCPYDIDAGWGLPQITTSGTATGGSSTTIVDSGKNFTALGVAVDDWVVAENGVANLVTGQVTIVGTTTLTVDNWRFGTAPANGWSYIVGPEYTSCKYTFPACDNRGMGGPNDNRPPEELNSIRRRCFCGWTPPSKETVPWRWREDWNTYHEGTSYPTGNRGLYGTPIPIPVGGTKMKGVKPVAYFNAGDFTHFLFIVGEARVNRVREIRVSGHPIDPQPKGTSTAEEWEDSLIYYSFDGYTGANDQDGVTAGELTQTQQKQGVGSLQSWTHGERVVLEQYENNPDEFNSALGSGISQACTSFIRVRIQAQVDPTTVEADFTVNGGTVMEKVAGGTWVSRPDMAEVAYNAFTNNRWGGGLSTDQMDATSWAAGSTHCRSLVSKTQTEVADKSGTIGFGPKDGPAPSGAVSGDWVFIRMTEDPQPWRGALLTVTVNATPYERRVISVRPEFSIQETAGDPEDAGGYGEIETEENEISYHGGWFIVDEEWDSVDIPSRGDSYTLEPHEDASGQVYRYMANGVLNNKEKKFGAAVKDILRCMNADWVQHLGKVYLAMRKDEDLVVVDARMTITDYGASRNVVINRGKSSAKLVVDPVNQAFNAINVQFPNQQKDYVLDPITIKSSASQLRMKEQFNEDVRDQVKGSVHLPLVSDIETAARLGTLIARERGIRAGNRHNAKVKCQMPVHIAMKMIPVADVYPLDFDGFPAYVQYGRVESIDEDLNKLTATVTFSVYYDADYDDTAEDQRHDLNPGEITDSSGNPIRFKLVSQSEGSIEGVAGNYVQTIDYEITLPS